MSEIIYLFQIDLISPVQLSGLMGDVAKGVLELYRPEDKTFHTSCITLWDPDDSPRAICARLGYTWVTAFPEADKIGYFTQIPRAETHTEVFVLRGDISLHISYLQISDKADYLDVRFNYAWSGQVLSKSKFKQESMELAKYWSGWTSDI